MDTLLHLRRAVVLPDGKPSIADLTEHAGAMLDSSWARPGFFHRAHPDWVIDFPAKGAPVELHGTSPQGPIRFALPALSVVADFVHGQRVGELVLAPQMLVLLPEASAFYILFKRTLQLAPHADVECSMRLRLVEDWRRDDQGA
jgi:hypothetical protein